MEQQQLWNVRLCFVCSSPKGEPLASFCACSTIVAHYSCICNIQQKSCPYCLTLYKLYGPNYNIGVAILAIMYLIAMMGISYQHEIIKQMLAYQYMIFVICLGIIYKICLCTLLIFIWKTLQEKKWVVWLLSFHTLVSAMSATITSIVYKQFIWNIFSSLLAATLLLFFGGAILVIYMIKLYCKSD